MFNESLKHKNKILSAILVLGLLITACVPTVFAEALGQSSSESGAVSEGGFASLEVDGGMLLVGTAEVPVNSSERAAVKYIYSDSFVLNEKSAELILRELKSLGITISEEMLVSDSDVPAELIGKNGRRAIFACGSAEKPSELISYTPGKTAEDSFKLLYPAYNFSTSGYSSLKSLFSGSDTVTLSEDGQTAYCSVAMDESYTEKIINGKPVTILMINSEYKYSFRAPKMTFVEDYGYITPSDVISPGDNTVSDAPASTTATTSQTAAETDSLTAAATAPSAASTTADTTASQSSTTVSTTTSAVTTQTSRTTSTSATTASSKTTTQTGVTTQKSTASATTSKTSVRTTTSTTSESNKYIKPSAPSVPSATPTTTNTNPVFNRTTINALSSQRGIVNTRRLPLNVRSGPGKSYMVVTVLPKGAYMTVLSTENPDWYMIKTMGKVVGYAYSEYIRIM